MLRKVGGLQEHTATGVGIDDGLVAVLGVGDVALVIAGVAHSGIAATHVDTLLPLKVGSICTGAHTHLFQSTMVFIPLGVGCVDGMLEAFDADSCLRCRRLHNLPLAVGAVTAIQTDIST